METLLEQQRRYHEERERLLDAMSKETMHSTKTQKEKINSDHRHRQLLDRYVEVSSQLKNLYEDRDGQRKEEVAALSGPNEFLEFYSRLKGIKDFHRKHPNEICVPMSVEFDKLKKIRENTGEDFNMADFTDEEGYGKYLDMHECYEAYINLKSVDKIDYLTYLSTFDHLYEFPKERKNTAYKTYVGTVLDYLDSYISRVRPLLDVTEEMDSVHHEFETSWSEGTVPGWRKETSSALTHAGAHLDLSAFSSWEELASLGLDRLKSALLALGLKCGGTLEQRSQRLFSTKGQNLEDLDSSLFAKKKPGKTEQTKESGSDKHKVIAELEAQLYRLTSLVEEQRAATIENVQRKQARTEDERNESDGEHESEGDSDDDDDIPYNPKNLPLGWDGKPIPYWLYKLHGLNISYNCEICGNFTYKGPKTFQKHFSESRHAYGMRCLGIPNTAHFANVTSIEDSLALWERIKKTKDEDRWKPDMEEEFEDSIGNVVNKKIYDDLQKQGVL